MIAPMPGGGADPSRPPDTAGGPRSAQIRRAAGIYGLIVTAAVLASAGGSLRTVPMGLAVFVTLIVYWVAEEYAQLEAHASAGHLPTWQHVRSALAAKWPMVSASYVPLLALVAARALGATPANAAYIALAVTVVMLTVYGWVAGRASRLHGITLFLMTVAAGALGVLMVLLKIVITHLH